MIYLDNAATTKMSQKAIETYVKATNEYFANPSSLHEQGEKAKLLLEKCREELANLLRAEKNEIYFTSGGSESNIRVLESLFLANRHKGNHVITTAMEHPSVHSFFKGLEKKGIEVTYVDINNEGQVTIEELKKCIRPTTFLASIQHVNSEIGTIQSMKKIGTLLKENDIVFHSDCVQSFGKLPIDVHEWNIDAVSISSHKIHGPKGVGAVFLSSSVLWEPIDPFTSHEGGFRQGTVNTPGIAAFTAAAMDICSQQRKHLDHIWDLRNTLINELAPIRQLLLIEGGKDKSNQLPHIIGMGLHGIEGQYMLLTLDRFGICISTGSACQSDKQDPSVVMKALHRSSQEAKRFFRISMGIYNTEEEIKEAAKRMIQCFQEKEGYSHGRKT
ncbi:IscS subfamily cysteine desulfurase [Evansella sp. AB-P1]|uniref:IscS subfamily cysteine desulfurase n=1 Tax=Evansella sp. AB-P1 TaxID=3037653 RepID=UPI00242027F1|nr:IscS subfamily cysteine desulfurase [Evansella sp. AB-P1]MDG5786366.1 IscS subfamily cysteine desulfurase [Evansella sp. AB-P1]